MVRPLLRWTYHYSFQPFQLQPLLETEIIVQQEDVVQTWAGRQEAIEKPFTTEKKGAAVRIAEIEGEAESIGERQQVQTEKKGKRLSRSYALTYYNPVTDKTELLATQRDIHVQDVAQQMIEEARGTSSTYPLYSFITAPIMAKEVKPYLLQQILNEREYDTPPPFGGGTRIRVTPEKTAISMVVPYDQARAAIVETLRRKETIERKLGREIMLLTEAVALLREKKTAATALNHLGPLTRARFLIAWKKKKLPPKVLVQLLEEDIRFLNQIKKKLRLLSVEGLMDLVKAMKKLQEK